MSKLGTISANGTCIIDGTIFEQTANGNKLTCSPECKKKWDVKQRQAKKYTERIRQYRRLGDLLGIEDGAEASMLRKQMKHQTDQLATNGRVIAWSWLVIIVLIITVIVLAAK